MPVHPFNGNTFVAFMDIAGFTAMMTDGSRGEIALNAFYSTGYKVLGYNNQYNNQGVQVDGLFISDCGVFFVHDEVAPNVLRLESLCQVVKLINERMFANAIQLTTSIAWGRFCYNERIEFPGIEKNFIYGGAYVAAFRDNNAGTPKLFPSECRMIRKDLPEDIIEFCSRQEGPIGGRMREAPNHFYFEWMRHGNIPHLSDRW